MSDSSYVFVDPDGRVRVPSPPQEWQYVSQSEYDPQHPAVVVVSRRDDTEPALLNEPQSGSVKAEGQSLLYTFEDEEVATNTTSSNSVTMTEVALPEYTFSAGQRDRVRQQQAEDAKRIADMIQLQEEERRRASEEHDRAVALEIIRREEEAATLQRANEAQRESERLAHQLAVELRERERAEEEAHRLAAQRLAEEEHRQRLKEEVARQQAVTQERAKALEAASRLEAEHMRLETERRYREHLRMEEERAKAAEEEDRRMAEQLRANSMERFDEDRLRQLAEDEAVARAMAESETTEVAPPPVAVSVGCRCLGASRGFHRVDCPLK